MRFLARLFGRQAPAVQAGPATAPSRPQPDRARSPSATTATIKRDFPLGSDRYDTLAAGVTQVLDRAGDEGVRVAARIVLELAHDLHVEVVRQVTLQNERSGRDLRLVDHGYHALFSRTQGWPLGANPFALECGYHPFIHFQAALSVVERNATTAARAAEPDDLLDELHHLLEFWIGAHEFGEFSLDEPDEILLAALIGTTSSVWEAAGRPPVPPFVDTLASGPSELTAMSRTVVTDYVDSAGISFVHDESHIRGKVDVADLVRRRFDIGHPVQPTAPEPAGTGAAVAAAWDQALAGDEPAARVAFEAAMRHAGEDDVGEAALALGTFLHEYSARSRDLPGAESAYRRAIDSGHPDHSPAAAFYLGVLLDDRGDLAGARRAFGLCLDHPTFGPRARNCLEDLP